jgi:hypothetical protein
MDIFAAGDFHLCLAGCSAIRDKFAEEFADGTVACGILCGI